MIHANGSCSSEKEEEDEVEEDDAKNMEGREYGRE